MVTKTTQVKPSLLFQSFSPQNNVMWWGYLCSLCITRLACTLPSPYTLLNISVVFSTAISTSFYIFVSYTCIIPFLLYSIDILVFRSSTISHLAIVMKLRVTAIRLSTRILNKTHLKCTLELKPISLLSVGAGFLAYARYMSLYCSYCCRPATTLDD